MNQELITRCQMACNSVRRSIINMTYLTGSTGAHLGGSLSSVELLTCLYMGNMRYQVNNPAWEKRDRVILSKGHAAMALYAAMAEAGIIAKTELATFKKDGSKLGGHPSLNGLPGIEFASGSLGQGLSLGVGTCIALKRKHYISSRVFVLLGDGECNEGSVWEAVASAAHFGLNRLTAIVDINSIQYDGYTKDILSMAPFADKWKAFGWQVLSVDGHDVEEVLDAYEYKCDKPVVILAATVKGKGISFMENNFKYHNASLSKNLYEQALVELEQNDRG